MLSRLLPPTIHQLLSSSTHPASTIHVNGWVKSVRRQKKVSFAVINDGSCTSGLQHYFMSLNRWPSLTNGASVRLTGKLEDSLGAGQEKELQVESVQVWGECDPEVCMLASRFRFLLNELVPPQTYPIQKQALSTEYLRDNCHLRARTDTVAATLRLRNATLRRLHSYFENEGFCYVHTPILTSNDCEGAGEAFRIAPIPPSPSSLSPAKSGAEFFSRPSYLTVSSQLHLEALASAISRVYTLSPCFRAEPSQTSRHLAEFWMLEAEWAFTNRVDDVCDVVEAVIKDVLRSRTAVEPALWSGDNERSTALEDAGRTERPWTRMSYTNAVRELSKHERDFEFAPGWGRVLQSEHEKWLAEKLVGGPVFITDYPVTLKPFYMRLNDEGQTVGCFDLLVPHVGELAGGSLREERVGVLEESLARKGLVKSEYSWYVDLRKYGGAPHGGFGLGFERLIAWLRGIENVRECIAMPRWAGRMLL